MATCVYALVTFFLVESDAYRLPIKVFEISKTKHQDSRVDTQYYDPDPELTRIDRNNKKNLNNLAHYIVNSFHKENDNDYKYKDEENLYVDKKSLPVVILSDEQTIYPEKRRNYRILHKLLHSALRSNGGEERTAAPRHRGKYEDDDYD